MTAYRVITLACARLSILLAKNKAWPQRLFFMAHSKASCKTFWNNSVHVQHTCKSVWRHYLCHHLKLHNFNATFHQRFTFFLPYNSRCLKRSVVSSWVFRPRAMTDRSEVTTDMSTVSSNSSSNVSELGLIFNPIML